MGASVIRYLLLLFLLGSSPYSDALICHKGIMWRSGRDFAEIPVEWTSYGTQRCEPFIVCQETLLLVDVGRESLLMGSKSCSEPGAQDDISVHIYSRPPAMLIASYSHFCSTGFCNDAQNTSILLSSFTSPAAPAPGGKRCPACVQIFGACSPNTDFVGCSLNSDSVTCRLGTARCYSAKIKLLGGGLSATMGIQGCLASSAKSLLGKSKTIGIFSVEEISDDDNKPLRSGASTSSPAWLSGLGFS